VTIVAAAGNGTTSDKMYPGAFESVIGVTATDHDDRTALFSNFGDWVDVSAPGSASTPRCPLPGHDELLRCRDELRLHVRDLHGQPQRRRAGALILARYPDLTQEQVREALINTSDDLGAPGFDPYFGYGRVNADNAMRMDTIGPMELVKWQVADGAQATSNGNSIGNSIDNGNSNGNGVIDGNGDGVINPGEKVALTIFVKNRGGQNAGAPGPC